MKSFYSIMAAIIMGMLIGTYSAFQAISTGWGVDVTQNRGWRIFENLAVAELSVYARAYLVSNGHLPLPQDQALYFFTYVDSDGDSLAADCKYSLKGDDMDAFWWSISAHDTQFEQFENSSHRYSFNMTNIIRQADGKYDIVVAAQVNDGNWLPLNRQAANGSENFMLSLRLYGIDKKMAQNVETISLPHIRKMGCE